MTEHMTELVNSSREYREKLLHDIYRPKYHFAIPEGLGLPFDANAGIFYNGRHHMFYIFQDENGKHCFGHYASHDLLHWTMMPIGPRPADDNGVGGMFSGNAFIDGDGKVRIMYHNFTVGNDMLIAEDDELTEWKPNSDKPMTPVSEDCDNFRSWDPFGWYEDGKYYAIYGWYSPALFVSDDGVHFSYVGDFIPKEESPLEPHEDVSCPDFFKMNGKDVLMHISHSRGWQWEIGSFDGKQFHPEHHGRMNFPGGQYFAGESYYDDKGRRILTAWVIDALLTPAVNELGWSGVMSMPRVVTMSDDQTELYSQIPEEMRTLRYNARPIKGTVKSKMQAEAEICGKICENGRIGVRFNFSDTEYVDCYYDSEKEKLCIDLNNSTDRDDVFYLLSPLDIIMFKGKEELATKGEGYKNRGFREYITDEMFECGEAKMLEAPLKSEDGRITLNAFVDGSILEVFANGKQALTVRIYPKNTDKCSASVISENSTVEKAELFDIAPTNMY